MSSEGGSIDMTRPLTRTEAEELTSHIRNAADVMWVLIARAHAGRVWEALDYPSWEAYVRDEFNMSRSRAYQLLDQAKVVAAIQAAAPVGTQVELTEKSARDLKKVLTEVVDDVADRTDGMTPDDAEDTIDDILNEWRSKADQFDSVNSPTTDPDDPYGLLTPSSPAGGGVSGGGPLGGGRDPLEDFDVSDFLGDVDSDEDDAPAAAAPNRPTPASTGVDPAALRRTVQACYDLYSSLSSLKAMPDIEAIIKAIPAERYDQVSENLPLAIDWLSRFAVEWEAHRAPADGEDAGNSGDIE